MSRKLEAPEPVWHALGHGFFGSRTGLHELAGTDIS